MGYLVYDRLYETEATISSPVLDAGKPFAFVFTITNNSHLFSIVNVRWSCTAIRFINEHGGGLRDASIFNKTPRAISPGQKLNVNCNANGFGKFFNFDYNFKIAEAVMSIKIDYDVTFFWGYTYHRSPYPTKFTWFKDAATPQWIQGEFPQ